MKFYNRIQELKYLFKVDKLAGKRTQLTVLTGRRRVGKTELVKHFLNKQKNNLARIGKIIAVHFGAPYENLNNSEQIQKDRKSFKQYKMYKEKIIKITKEKNISCFDVKVENGKVKKYQIAGISRQKKLIIFDLKEIYSTDAAEKLVGMLVSIPKDSFEPLAEGEHYYFELIGLPVFTEKGKFLGEIDNIFPTGSNDVYTITNKEKEYLIPAIAEVVTQIDLKNRRVVVRPLEGLFEDDDI